jgi:hypothetical protein
MAEFIAVQDLNVDLTKPLKTLFAENHFIEFRITPKLLVEQDFPPGIGVHRPKAHFFKSPAGAMLEELPAIMQDRILRPPENIREVISLGAVLNETQCDYWIYAPKITGQPKTFLRLVRYPDWKGYGLMFSNHNPDDQNLWDLELIGFSS